jgi:hypothetical protein
MTLNNAHNFFEDLVSETSKKSEIKIYKKFLQIIDGLRIRDFSNEQILSIEVELDILNLKSNPVNRKRHFNKALNAFEGYLKDTYSLTRKGYYGYLGIALGSSFGMLFGLIVLSRWERSMGITMGTSLGMLIGMVIGRGLDTKALKENRTL